MHDIYGKQCNLIIEDKKSGYLYDVMDKSHWMHLS